MICLKSLNSHLHTGIHAKILFKPTKSNAVLLKQKGLKGLLKGPTYRLLYFCKAALNMVQHFPSCRLSKRMCNSHLETAEIGGLCLIKEKKENQMKKKLGDIDKDA